MRVLTFALLLVMASLAARGQEFSIKVKLSHEYVTKTQMITDRVEMIALSKKYNSDGLRPMYPNAKNPELSIYFNFKGKGDVRKAIDELLRYNEFQSIEEDKIVYPLSCSNPHPPLNDAWLIQNPNYALELINARCAWSITKGNPSIIIGIADTDFEITHEDLVNQIVSIDGPVSYSRPHGTRVAGVAGAETYNRIGVAGIGYNSKIAAHRIAHFENGGAWSTNVRAAIWALYQAGMPIINVSWSGTGLAFAAAEEITQNGTVLILSAGNDNDPERPPSHNHIADIPGVIIVSSVNSNNEHGPTGHARNQWVDICAPGVRVAQTDVNNGYRTGSGTSYAAPLVSGTIALMLSVNPCLTPANIETFIKRSADRIADAHLYPGMLGAGRVNAYKAVKQAGTRNISYTTLSGYRTLSAGYIFNIGNASVGANSNITLRSRGGVNIGPFNVPLGSSFEIIIDPNAVNDCN